MNKYKDLKSGKKVPENFRKEFEKAMQEAWEEYNNGSRAVDQFEDNYTECAFAKGFLAGCIYRDEMRE